MVESHWPLVVRFVNDVFSCCKRQHNFICVCVKSSKELVCLVTAVSDASLKLAILVSVCHMHHKTSYTVFLAVGSEGLFANTSTRFSQFIGKFIGKYLDWIVTGSAYLACWLIRLLC